ncbi:polyprenyl synthetase family protein [Anaerosolibacter sp.]|uniref:polyprenyl synthetase family protein n=1 Tax=Anaerosolibacter sp. TaxID=1872527 RepID=UPI0039EFE652
MSYWSKYPDIEKEMTKVEELLDQAVRSRRKIAEDASLDLLKAGGKRIRPALTIISAQYGNYDSDKAVSMAAALELFHMATLIHDDIIDNAKSRRGIETAQSKYGKDVAVYTGDYLFSKAFLLAAKVNNGEKIIHLSKFIKAICEGEIEQYASKYDHSTSVATYLKRIKYKTALLFALCCQIGAETADCDVKTTRNLRRFGMALGTAFQIKDDLLDVTSEDAIIGKPAGNDILEGIYTLPLLYTIKNNKQHEDILKLLNKDSLTKKDVTEIIYFIHKSNGIEDTRKMEERYYQKALDSLSRLSSHRNTQILEDLVTNMRDRIK